MKIAVALLILALAACGGSGRFDSEVWKAHASQDERDNPRAGMLADLRPRLRPGMSRTEVEGLLGAGAGDGVRVSYALGMAAYGADYEYFVIEYDAAGRLTRTSLVRG